MNDARPNPDAYEQSTPTNGSDEPGSWLEVVDDVVALGERIHAEVEDLRQRSQSIREQVEDLVAHIGSREQTSNHVTALLLTILHGYALMRAEALNTEALELGSQLALLLEVARITAGLESRLDPEVLAAARAANELWLSD